jgi:hypothetical protein
MQEYKSEENIDYSESFDEIDDKKVLKKFNSIASLMSTIQFDKPRGLNIHIEESDNALLAINSLKRVNISPAEEEDVTSENEQIDHID